MELLIALGIVAVLIAIALPALSQVRRKASSASNAAALRQCYVGLGGYSADHLMHFPFLGTPGDAGGAMIVNGVTVQPAGSDGTLFFMRNGRLWASLVREYLPSNPKLEDGDVFTDQAIQNPHAPGLVFSSRYHMTFTAFALPDFWTDVTPWTDSSKIRGTRLSHVRNPARKGILLDVFSHWFSPVSQWRDHSVLIAFCDGSVRAETAYPSQPTVSPPYFFGGSVSPYPIMQTANGLAGIDY